MKASIRGGVVRIGGVALSGVLREPGMGALSDRPIRESAISAAINQAWLYRLGTYSSSEMAPEERPEPTTLRLTALPASSP